MKTLLLVLMLCSLPSLAANYTASRSGNWSDPATWSGAGVPGAGDTAVCSLPNGVIMDDVNTIVGSSPASGNVVTLTNGCKVVAARNTTLIVQGGFSGSYQYSFGSVLQFDSSNAANPHTTNYVFTTVNLSPSADPPSASGYATITANTITGAPFKMSTSGTPATTLSDVTISHLGTTTTGWTYTSTNASTLNVTGGVIFDTTCGLKWTPGSVNEGYAIIGVSWKHTLPGCYPWYYASNRNASAGVIRKMSNSVFDAQPYISHFGDLSNQGRCDNDIFLAGWNDPGIFIDLTKPYLVTNSFTVFDAARGAGAQSMKGGVVQNTVFPGDTVTNLVNGVPATETPADSGTATSGTSSTLKDASKAWTANAYQSAGTGARFMVSITGGTGAGQVRSIETNTANTLTIRGITWDGIPDATSTYRIYATAPNPHWTDGPITNVSPLVLNYTGNYFGGWGLSDNNGDVYHAFVCGVAGGGTYVYDYSIVFPSIAHDNSGTFITVGSDVGSTCLNNASHITAFSGAQSNFAMNEGRIDPNPHTVGKFLSNITWEESRTYTLVSGGTSLGGWALLDEVLSSGPIDLVQTNCSFGGFVSCADYNDDVNQKQTGRAATDQPGSNPAYNVKTSVIMGAHDVRNTDPQFVNQWATIQTWYQSLGHDTSIRDPLQVLPDIYTCMATLNDYAGMQDPNCTVANLYAYLKAAMAPQNVLLHNTAHDGGDIGAVPYVAPAPTLVSIAVTPAAASIAVASTQQFTALGTYSDASTADLTATATWSSTNTAAATINSSGLATGIAAGTANITATQNSITSNTSVLTVTAGAATLVSIAVTPNPVTIINGATQQFTATGTYSDSSTSDLTTTATWSSSATSVATIAATGLATGVSAGSTNIIAVSGSVTSNNAVLNVKVLTSIAVTPVSATIGIGATQSYTATGTYSDSSTADLTATAMWSSTNTAVATINASGVATGTAAGTTNICATQSSITSNASVLTVTAAPPVLVAITITPTLVTIINGGTQQFSALGTYSDSSTSDLTAIAQWTSSAANVATIAAGGLATGVSAGSTTITAAYAAVTSNAAILSVKVLTSITLTPSSANIKVGATQAYTALGTYSDQSTADVTATSIFNSSNLMVATIMGSTATAIQGGATNITAQNSGVISSASPLRVFASGIR